MNGTNGSGATLQVTEIFKSIQGESTWAGLPCGFVRLTGCPLRCAYCDTTYAYDGGTEMKIGEILEACAALDVPMIEVTGGEPLAQANCPVLVDCLLQDGYTVLVETSGALPINKVSADAIRIMDIKCPGSGMADRMDWANIERLTERDEVKFVIADRADYEWSRDVIQKFDLPSRCRQILMSPFTNAGQPPSAVGLNPGDVVKWMLQDGLKARFQLQLHKQIWPPEQRGV